MTRGLVEIDPTLRGGDNGDVNDVCNFGRDGRLDDVRGGNGGDFEIVSSSVSWTCGYVRRLRKFRSFNRGLKLSRNDLTDMRSSDSSSNAGDRGRGLDWTGRSSTSDVEENELLLLAERRLGLDVRAGTGGGGSSLNRLSRYAGRLPDVEGRASAMAIVYERCVVSSSFVQTMSSQDMPRCWQELLLCNIDSEMLISLANGCLKRK